MGSARVNKIDPVTNIPIDRICQHYGASIQAKTGFYGFAYYDSLSKGQALHWIESLYEAGIGPQQPTRKKDMTARFDVCGGCLGPFLTANMASLKQQQSRAGACRGIQLPAHMTLSPEETAAACRLTRLLRYNDAYWLRFFVEWLLHRDASESTDLSPEDVEAMLKDMKNPRNWDNYLSDMRERCTSIAHHRALDGPQATTPINRSYQIRMMSNSTSSCGYGEKNTRDRK
jgi:hypothetical protein